MSSPIPASVFRAIDIAIRELGVHEATGKNDGIPAKRYMRGDELAWCAGFVLFCNEESDDQDVTPTDWAYYAQRSVKTMMKHFQDNGAFISAKMHGFTPMRNDIIFFGHTASDVGVVGSHVGLVEFVKDGWVHTIEGNTSNMVARRKYKLTDKSVIGYGRVELMPVGIDVAKPAKKK